jgi:integrase
MAQRITDKLVRDIAPPAKGQTRVKDDPKAKDGVRGFQVVVRQSGSKAFALDYSVNGRERRLTIGEYGAWTVKAARDQAAEYRKQVDQGIDPLESRDERRKAATVDELADLYERDHLWRKRDQRNDKQLLNNYIRPEIGKKKVQDVRRTDIRELHRKVTRSGKSTRANRILALLSKMFNLAINDYEMRADNPVKGVEKNREQQRERYLSQVEIQAVSQALNEYPSQNTANAIRWLMLTGCRTSEALHMTWDQVRWDDSIWIKPATNTKTKTTHRVPLSPPAMQLLRQIAAGQPTGEEYVFPGRKPGEPLKRLNDAWQDIRKWAGVEDVRLHDLRHTYASILVSAGLSLPMIGALLGHTTQATTQRYAHLYDDPLRRATEHVGNVVTGSAQNGHTLNQSGSNDSH